VRRHRARVLFVGCLCALFAACEGDDGARGPAGPAGAPGPPPAVAAGDASAIEATISDVTINSAPIVTFRLSDGSGRPVIGLPASAVSFMIAKLVPGADGNASRWQSYLIREEIADGEAPDMLPSALQGTTESGTTGTFTDFNDGSYSYRFSTDVTTVADVSYDPTLTHRVSLQIRGFAPVVNPVYTFRPSDGATTDLFTRDIVKTETCNRCHEQLALHGGGRRETRTCVLCHNPGTTDQDSGNTVDFKVMIHKIHHGADLPSVEAGGEYAIYGFSEREHNFSEVEFPQDIRNCTNCHDGNDPATPNGGNWMTAPTREACGSCHDDVDFVTGIGHSEADFPASNADCTICHSDGGFVGPIEESHALLEQRAADEFQYNIIDISGTGPGEFPAVTFSVTDPTNGDAAYDIELDAPFTQGGGASRLAVSVGWQTTDYSNEGSQSASAAGGTPAQPIGMDPLFGGSVETGDNVFTVTSSTPLPNDVAGSGIVAIDGHPAHDVDGDGTVDRIPVTSASAFFAITDMAAVPRRQVVDIEKCQNCHQSLSLHGGNRTDNINLCVTCHNPNATDINRRSSAGIDASNAVDGKDEQATDFKRMIHMLHAGGTREAPLVVYGFNGSIHDFSHVVFPGRLSNCGTCHRENTYYPVGPTVQATTIDTGPDRSTAFDDINISPNAAVCTACHDSDLAQAHVEQNGGAFDVVQGADGMLISLERGAITETCSVCHGPGRLADVEAVHGF
jgi:OmcA/MtrC family decaheme c-type cytochrome